MENKKYCFGYDGLQLLYVNNRAMSGVILIKYYTPVSCDITVCAIAINSNYANVLYGYNSTILRDKMSTRHHLVSNNMSKHIE